MGRIRRVLAATDFSRGAESAVRRAALVARDCGARLEVVHVLQAAPLDDAWRKLAEEGGLSERRLLESTDFRLRELAAGLERRFGVAPDIHVAQGRAPQVLTDRARETGADLMVVGAHGERFLLDLFVGATALKVLRLASCPVLLVKQTPPFDYERVLVATDFSPAARSAARLVGGLFPRADLHLFHAYEVPFEREMYYAGSDDEAIDHYRRLGEAHAKQQLEDFAASLGEPDRFLRRVRHGYAPALINHYAAETGADLVALGFQGRSGLSAGLLGSVSSHLVLEAPGDLLLVPPLRNEEPA